MLDGSPPTPEALTRTPARGHAGERMLKRLIVGLVLGLVVGSLVAAGAIALLGPGQMSPLIAYALAAVTGVLTGLVAGKPIWAKGGQIEAGLKAFFGALLAAGGMFAIRTWLHFDVDLAILHGGGGGERPPGGVACRWSARSSRRSTGSTTRRGPRTTGQESRRVGQEGRASRRACASRTTPTRRTPPLLLRRRSGRAERRCLLCGCFSTR